MKAELTAREIADFLGVTKRAILKKGWPYTEKPNPYGGNLQKYFIFNKLPLEIQKALDASEKKAIAAELNCDPQLFPQKNFDENKAKALLNKWNSASEQNRTRANIRLQLLESLETFCKSNGYKQTAGENAFALLYKNKTIPGVDAAIYGIESAVSAVNLRRWRSAYRKAGLSGLLMSYQTNSGKSRAITPEIQIFIISHIGQKPHIKPATLHKLIEKTFEPHPSRKTVYRFVQNWKKEHPQEYALLENPTRWKNSFMPAFGDAAAGVDHISHTLQIDGTPADFIANDGTRGVITGCIDVFSRQAVVFVAPTSKSIAIALCIRKAILKWGVPSRIMMDNGKDYKSEHITAIAQALEIETPPLPKYTPEKKPHIERFFGTMTRGVEELMPGFCGHSVADRQAIRARETWAAKIMEPGPPVDIPLSIQEFSILIDKWLEVYHNSEHRGLNGKNPQEKARESKYFPPKIRDKRVLDILLAPVSRPRIIQKKGISIDGVNYHSPELIDHIGKRIIARRDLENAGLIYVFNATRNEYICTATNEPLQGERLENYMEKKNHKAKEIRQRVRAIKGLNIGNGGRTALQILLEDTIEHPPEKIIPFQAEAETPAILEARKAAKDTESQQAAIDSTPFIQKNSRMNKIQFIDPADTSWMTKEDLDREYEAALKHASAHKKASRL